MELSFIINDYSNSRFKKNTAKNQLLNFVENIPYKVIVKFADIYNDQAKELESFYLTIHSLDEQDLEKSYKLVKAYSKNIIKQYEIFEKIDFYENDKLKQSLNNLTKQIFKCEASLHKAYYKDVALVKTDRDILQGLSKINSNNLSNLLDAQ